MAFLKLSAVVFPDIAVFDRQLLCLSSPEKIAFDQEWGLLVSK
jgi:hypothetical protein